jgi:FkbM family methyltransferase
MKKNPKYFSQFGEDSILWKFFNKTSGFFIEVGAFDGVHFSNSYCFELMGWKGICVEPHPNYFPLCKLNRPKSNVVNCACVSNQEIKEVKFMTEKIGLLSGISVDQSDVANRYLNRGLLFDGFETVVVRASTLENIIQKNHHKNHHKNQEIDFISVDVEGTEIDVLKGLNIEKYKPKVFIIEANNEKARVTLIEYFKNYPEYFLARTLGVNIFFVRGRKEAMRLADISVDQSVEQQSHPLGENYTIQSDLDMSKLQNSKISNLGKIGKSIKNLLYRMH